MQGEPEFDRLKRELEEVKNQPRGLEGTFRTAAEMERHRAQLADAAIEEQLEVQTAFREHGARLQVIFRTAMFWPLLFMGSNDHHHQLMAVLMHISLTPQLRCTLCRMYLTKAYVIFLRKAQTGCSRSISYTPVAPALCFYERRDMSLPCLLYSALYPAQPDVNQLNLVWNASVMFPRAFMTSGSAQSTRWSTVSRRSSSCKAGLRQS